MKKPIFLTIIFLGLIFQALAQDQAKAYSGEKFSSLDEGIDSPVTATIIYDNYVHTDGLKADWGYSILIEGAGKTILFDTGTNPKIFRENFEKMKLDASNIDEVFISHEHGDHFGGLHEFLSLNKEVKVVVPETFSERFISDYINECKALQLVSGPAQISRHLYTTGVMGEQIPEQALVLNTSKGLIVMTGCSHPGIIEMLNEIKETFGKDIYLVFGGFHLMMSSSKNIDKIIAEMKELGVQKCGATHCTGEKQIGWFREAFGENFVEMGVGNKIIFN